VILVEAGERVLPAYPRRLSLKAEEQLRDLGVTVWTNAPVRDVQSGRIVAADRTIESANILWGAGVEAVGLTRTLGASCDKHGRLHVEADLSVPGHPEVFAIGDLAAAVDADGQAVPGVAPAAMQMGEYVAKLLSDETTRDLPPSERPPFRYHDRGIMATIGRSRGVAWIYNRVQLAGLPAWLAWLGVHLLFLAGFRNKIAVMFNWFYAYLTFRRGARIITGPAAEYEQPAKAQPRYTDGEAA